MDNDPRPPDANDSKRRYNASKLVPRVEFGRQQPPPAPAAQEAAPLAPGDDQGYPGEPYDMSREPSAGGPLLGGPFGGGREFAGGRVRVYGCSPGCLMMSIVVSLILTLLLNAIF